MLEMDQIYNLEAIEGLKLLPDESIDMILCDLPYGVTRNSWDSPIDMIELWQQYKRVIKERGAIIIFGVGIFTAEMILMGRDLYRYNLVYEKTNATGFLNANRQPLRAHEDIMIFYKKQPPYNPQKTDGHPPTHQRTRKNTGTNYGDTGAAAGGGNTDRHPTSVLRFKSDKQKIAIHPTQKPVALLRWLIRSYTDKGAVVLDNACGSGSTCKAAQIEARHWIGFDNGYCETKGSAYYGKPWAEIAAERMKGAR